VRGHATITLANAIKFMGLLLVVLLVDEVFSPPEVFTYPFRPLPAAGDHLFLKGEAFLGDSCSLSFDDDDDDDEGDESPLSNFLDKLFTSDIGGGLLPSPSSSLSLEWDCCN
jgi:hypothetical protein